MPPRLCQAAFWFVALRKKRISPPPISISRWTNAVMCRGNEGRPLIWKEINDSQNAQQDFTYQLGGGISSASQSKKKITVRCILQRTCMRIYGIPQTAKHLNSMNRSDVQTLFMSRNLQAVFIKASNCWPTICSASSFTVRASF